MNSIVSKEMTLKNTVQTCSTESSNCTHENTKKAKKFGKMCALCHTRVWRFWKTRKCVGCKSVFHKRCIAALEKENAQNRTVEPVAVCTTEAVGTANAVTAVPTPATGPMTPAAASSTDDRIAPLYVSLAPWTWANVTVVTVDCRRRPNPLTVVVDHGYQLSAAMFRGLFDALPARRPRAPAGPSSARGEMIVANARGPPPSKHRRRRSVCKRCAAAARQAGDAGLGT